MKKTYIQYRSGLLLGLLSLNSLSSCVHIRQELGMDNTPSQQEEQVHNAEQGGNKDSSQTSGRFSWIPTAFRVIARPLVRIEAEQLLWIGEWAIIGYFLGEPVGHFLASTSRCATASLPAYLGSEV